MLFLIKYFFGVAVAGTATITLPVLATQTDVFKPTPKWENDKVECHGTKAYGLSVRGKVRVWATSDSSQKSALAHKYKGWQGQIIQGDNSQCPSSQLS